MEIDLYGPPLPPRFRDAQSEHGSDPNHGLDHQSDQSEQPEQVCSARQVKTQGSAKIYFSVFFRGGSVLCPHEKVF